MVHSAKSGTRSKGKGQKRERDLANHYGAIRIGAVAGALHHHTAAAMPRRTKRTGPPSGKERTRTNAGFDKSRGGVTS
jgi:hypothetical protein